jgi:hypothetical protein
MTKRGERELDFKLNIEFLFVSDLHYCLHALYVIRISRKYVLSKHKQGRLETTKRNQKKKT